jgi:hypothetical protein
MEKKDLAAGEVGGEVLKEEWEWAGGSASDHGRCRHGGCSSRHKSTTSYDAEGHKGVAGGREPRSRGPPLPLPPGTSQPADAPAKPRYNFSTDARGRPYSYVSRFCGEGLQQYLESPVLLPVCTCIPPVPYRLPPFPTGSQQPVTSRLFERAMRTSHRQQY